MCIMTLVRPVRGLTISALSTENLKRKITDLDMKFQGVTDLASQIQIFKIFF
jgi:hypothetical protein